MLLKSIKMNKIFINRRKRALFDKANYIKDYIKDPLPCDIYKRKSIKSLLKSN